MTETRAEIRLPTRELRDDLPFFTKTLKMRLDMIYPADNPEIAVLSGHGLRLRIEKGAPELPGTIRILTEDPDGFAGGHRQLDGPQRHHGSRSTSWTRRWCCRRPSTPSWSAASPTRRPG